MQNDMCELFWFFNFDSSSNLILVFFWESNVLVADVVFFPLRIPQLVFPL